jgi:hypothetical protein
MVEAEVHLMPPLQVHAGLGPAGFSPLGVTPLAFLAGVVVVAAPQGI